MRIEQHQSKFPASRMKQPTCHPGESVVRSLGAIAHPGGRHCCRPFARQLHSLGGIEVRGGEQRRSQQGGSCWSTRCQESIGSCGQCPRSQRRRGDKIEKRGVRGSCELCKGAIRYIGRVSSSHLDGDGCSSDMTHLLPDEKKCQVSSGKTGLRVGSRTLSISSEMGHSRSRRSADQVTSWNLLSSLSKSFPPRVLHTNSLTPSRDPSKRATGCATSPRSILERPQMERA